MSKLEGSDGDTGSSIDELSSNSSEDLKI